MSPTDSSINIIDDINNNNNNNNNISNIKQLYIKHDNQQNVKTSSNPSFNESKNNEINNDIPLNTNQPNIKPINQSQLNQIQSNSILSKQPLSIFQSHRPILIILITIILKYYLILIFMIIIKLVKNQMEINIFYQIISRNPRKMQFQSHQTESFDPMHPNIKRIQIIINKLLIYHPIKK